MGFRNFLVSTTIVTGLGVGGYLAYIRSLAKYLDVIPPEQAEQYFKAAHRNINSEAGARRLTFAYRAPTVLPTHHDVVEVFGEKAVAKQAAYVDASGAKKVGSIFRQKTGNAALGSLFALQALEKATPLLQLRAAALFWDNFQISAQWRLLLHNRKATMEEARRVVEGAKSASEAADLVRAYCAKVEDLTLEKVIAANPDLRMATMLESCGTAVAASVELPDKEKSKPREADLYVFYTAPIPEGVEEGSFGYKARHAWGDWYTRWLAVNATSALTRL